MKTPETFLVLAHFKVAHTASETVINWLLQKFGQDWSIQLKTSLIILLCGLPCVLKKIPTVCGSLREALQNLDKDRAFLKAGGVFNDDFIDSFIELKMTEVARFEMTPHPVEFTMYYSL